MTKTTATMIVTPPAPCAWPKLGTPDVYLDPDSGKRGNPMHRVKVILDPSDKEHAAFITKMKAIDETLESALEAAGRPTNIKNKMIWRIVREQVDKEGKETGLYEISFKKVVQGVKNGKSWEWPVTVFDRFGQPITSTEVRNRIGGGSIIQVAFTVGTPYNKAIGAGFFLGFEKVLVRELKEYQDESDASVFGDLEAGPSDWATDDGDSIFPTPSVGDAATGGDY